VSDRFNQEWELALEIPAADLKELRAKVPELKEKSELQFRVTAVNKAGPSPASEPTKMHIVKHKSREFNDWTSNETRNNNDNTITCFRRRFQ